MAPTKHAKFSPSSAHRWIPCPASIRLTDENWELVSKYQRAKDNSHAELGTAAHAVLESLLRGDSLDHNTNSHEYYEMLQHGQWARDIVRSHQHDETESHYEARVTIATDIFGTADVLVYDKTAKVLHVMDYKYGVHVVHATENHQLALYAAGAMQHFKWQPYVVYLHILQPRHQSGPRWDKYEAPLPWIRELYKQAIRATNSLHLPPKLGDHCQYCPAKPVCPAQLDEVRKGFGVIAGSGIELFEDKSPKALQEVAALYETRKQVEEWYRAAEALLIASLQEGSHVPGWRVAKSEGKKIYSKRKSTDEIISILKGLGLDEEKIAKTEKTLLPLSVIRKILGSDDVLQEQGVLQLSESKPRLVKGEDADAFPELED